MKENLLIFALMIITVPLAGELKIYPFFGTFRIGFGSPVFFFFLLWIRKIPLVLCGTIVGICVIAFRIILDLSTGSGLQITSTFMLHLPNFFYYLTYSCLFYLTGINDLHHHPLLVGFVSVFIEVSSSIVELFFNYLILGNTMTLYILGEIIIIAFIRSFFVLGFFNIIKLHQAKLAMEHQQEQNKRMLLLISSLYEESIQLKKSLQNAEDITRDCYDLYRNVQINFSSLKTDDFAKKMLDIAGQVHEIKKDNQRIYAGLSKMISDENSTDYMPMLEIGNIIVQTNQKYATSLEKNIKFSLNIEGCIPHFHVYTILSLVNNLVSNAVESIIDIGLIEISISRKDDWVEFRVSDNGTGVPLRKRELIFKPGYTTKYDLSGKPSTGMGLPYVKHVVENLKGIVRVEDDSEKNKTAFVIQLPINSLVEKG